MVQCVCPKISLLKDGTEAELVGFEVGVKREIIDSIPWYKGYGNLPAGEVLVIDKCLVNGKLIPVVKINACSFSLCRDLTTIVISSHVRNIVWNMYGCDNLLNIHVHPANEFYSSIDGVLFSKDLKTLVGFPSARKGVYKIPMGVKNLGNFAFKGSQISQIEIPNTLQHIGINVFYRCNNLKEIVIPHTLKSIQPNMNSREEYITQRFYFDTDVKRESPLTIQDLLRKFSKR